MSENLKILAAVDFSQASLEAVHWGAALARCSGGEMVLLAVADWPGAPSGEGDGQFTTFYDADSGLRVLLEKRLEALVMSTPFLAEVPTHQRVRFGVPEKEIVAAARDEGADLIVMGSHGRRGVRRALLGSVSASVLRNAPCAVTVIREGVHPVSEKLMLAEVR